MDGAAQSEGGGVGLLVYYSGEKTGWGAQEGGGGGGRILGAKAAYADNALCLRNSDFIGGLGHWSLWLPIISSYGLTVTLEHLC